MKVDIVLSGVGGQGVLAAAFVIAAGAMDEKLYVKQSEVHGMSQRGGAVVANLRISDKIIHSDTIALGQADLIISLEPLECFRYLPYLSEKGHLVTAQKPFVNIPDYPDINEVYAKLKQLPSVHLVDAESLAKEAGSALAVNMVMVGAASPFIALSEANFHKQIGSIFGRKGQNVVEVNQRAFNLGRQSVSV